MSLSPPLRFLAVVLGGWAALRAAIVAPPWPAPPAGASAAAAEPARISRPVVASRQAESPPPPPRDSRDRLDRISSVELSPSSTRPARSRPEPAALLPTRADAGRRRVEGWRVAAPPLFPPRLSTPPPPQRAPARASSPRWSLSAWSFVRRGDAAPLAAGGLLGGSQAGARLAYRLNGDPARPLALSVRLSAPLRRIAGAEAALGLDWRPSRRLPVSLLAERRLALGGEGRSAFGLTAYGGFSDAPLGRLRIDAYAQAGVVGARSRDLFGDGSLRVTMPVGSRARLGAGAWAAAQPGVARVDIGPHASLGLPLAGRTLTVAADWRLRVAGDARPGSGPALTLTADF